MSLQRYCFFFVYTNNQQFSYQNFNNPLPEQVFCRAYAIYLVSLQSERLLSEAMRKQTLPMNGVQRRGWKHITPFCSVCYLFEILWKFGDFKVYESSKFCERPRCSVGWTYFVYGLRQIPQSVIRKATRFSYAYTPRCLPDSYSLIDSSRTLMCNEPIRYSILQILHKYVRDWK